MPSSRGLAAEAVEVNPFYSERLRQELVLRSQRPEHLPAEEDEGRVPPVQNGRKGRGGDGTGLFATPPSLERPTVFGQQPTGMQSQGAMPMETPPTVQQTMGAMHGSERHEEVGMNEKNVGSVRPAVDELQRDLEVELVDFLRQQNAQLMMQVSDLKTALEARGDQASAGSSPWSTVVEGESLGKRSAMGAKRWSSRSPRPTRKQGHGSPVKLAGDGRVKQDDKLQCTPNGTRIPDGPPPMDDVSRMPSCPPPPVPPFPIPHTADAASDMTEKMDLKAYEVCQDGPLRGRMGDPGWKPTNEKSLTPQEAKSAWLEREVNSLKKVLEKVATDGNSFEISKAWPLKEGQQFWSSGMPLMPVEASSLEQRRLLHGELVHGDRASLQGASTPHGTVLGEPQLQARALHGVEQSVRGEASLHDRALHGAALGDGALHDRALHGAALGDGALHGRALHGTVLGDGALQGRALHGTVLGDGALPDRALHGGSTAIPGLQDPLQQGHPLQGAQGQGTMGVAPMPTSWESAGGGSGGKLELPTLPNGASPLEFGDWLCLCGPIMKDLSHVAGRWWDSTMRQAHAFYTEWKGLSPLQRVQLCPRLPDELMASSFIRTEQRGVTLLLKAVSEEQQKELVVDRDLTSTAILFRLYVRHQPGGPGEKAILLGQLTSLQKASSMQELASSLRTWRRHFARAREVEASLPDGVLLIKALETAVVQIAKEDAQAAFRLSTSRQQLALDQRPTEQSIWSFSQCLLAEAETLSLLKTSSTTSTSTSTPVRLKQMDAEASNSPQKPGTPGNYGNKSGKGQSTPMSEQPCKFFKSDTGCKAGRSCKWSHSWEGIEDKNSRCWICGGKDHRKTECKVKGNGNNNKPSSYDSGLGGGRGGGNQNAANNKAAVKQASVGKGHDGSAASSTTDQTSSSTCADGPGLGAESNSLGASSSATSEVDKGGAPAATPATTELLAEATQLLKSLRMPNLKVMRLSKLESHAQMVLLDSGATHGLRPAASEEEWQSGTRTQVMLADGVTESLRLKPGTKVLLSDPLLRPENTSWIVPMGCLNELNYKLVWKDHMCHLYTKAGEKIDVELHNGCPYVAHEFGAKLLTVLEQHQIQQELKKMTLKSILTRGAAGLGNNMSIEMAMLVKLKEVMPTLPEDLALKLVPDLSVLTDPNVGLNLPWNRRKRKRLMMAKNVIIHMYSGPDASYWERRLSNEHTEVLCVDLEASTPSNALDETTFAFLLSLCASKRVKALLGGPPCRTTSALRFQKDDGPPILRTEDHPYGLPSLTPQQAELVTNDSILWLRLMLLYILCEEVRPKEQAQTAFLCEQPQDPAEYRKKEDVDEHQYFSMWRTQEWKSFQEAYNAKLISFDQGPFGHPKRKPTTLALINMNEMMQLQDVRGRGAEPEVAPLPELSVKERCAMSKTWAAWAPGLKAAVAEAISRWIRREAPPREGPEDPTGVVYAEDDVRPVGVAAIGNVALQQWKQHYMQDHMPARRDCSHCVRSQGRSRAHRRVCHPESFTLSLDMSGRMTGGKDQTPGTNKYFLVGVYTYPVNKKGKPLLLRPDQDEEEDHPLPGLDDPELSGDPQEQQPGDGQPPQQHGERDQQQAGHEAQHEQGLPTGVAQDEPDPLQEESVPDLVEDEEVKSAYGMHDTWMRLINESKDVTVRNLTFAEPIADRNVHNVLPAIAKIYARLRSLGCPVYRMHSDRAREFLARPVHQWCLDRGIVQTMTPGSAFKTNGRAENEVGMIKKGARTLISAGACPLDRWPLAVRHVGERRLRNQLNQAGWPVGKLLRFGSKAYALKKSWQDRYAQWRDCREEVVVWGPAEGSSITTTTYYVKAIATERCFYTDDVVIPADDGMNAAVDAGPGGEVLPYLPERDGGQAQPLFRDGVPARRLRSKTAPPPAIATMSMLHIEGEKRILAKFGSVFEFALPPDNEIASEGSWTLETTLSPAQQHPPQEQQEVHDAPLPGHDDEKDGDGGQTETDEVHDQKEEESDVEEDLGEAPNSRDGGSSSAASNVSKNVLVRMSKIQALQTIHDNVSDYIAEEICKIDGTFPEQMWCLPELNKALVRKVEVEEQIQLLADEDRAEEQQQLTHEFLVTKTVSNKEVSKNLADWTESIKAEYEQLVVNKKAVKPMTRTELQKMAEVQNKTLEILPAKMVHTRKAGSGAYRSRAVVCGNYQTPNDDNTYAGGADATQIRTMLRISAQYKWKAASTDIRTAFLNAPRRDSRLIAMEVPHVYKMLGLAGPDEVWLIMLAMYGLQASPRDWCLHRDAVLPTLKWTRQGPNGLLTGSFEKTKDENVWRLEELDESGYIHWNGLMSVYVDDILVTGEEFAVHGALQALSGVWTTSSVEWAGVDKPLKYCGFEISEDAKGDGFHVNQHMYEQEMLQRWNVDEGVEYPHYKVAEDQEVEESPDPNDVRTAQAMAGSLLWLSSRTRPDLAHGVATMSRLMTKAPVKAIQIGTTLMKYVCGNPGVGLRYTTHVPDDWGAHGQLKVKRSDLLLEIFCDIAYSAGSGHRSVQGIVVCLGGQPICWQTSQQPFVTHSTAEAELVSYCEGLIAGKAAEALVMELTGVTAVMKVIYGDNIAAIGLANGTTSSSWRTRHLRIRASLLKQALDETDAAGGQWKLIHVRGLDLVADGFTKPLFGAAFQRFVENLGMNAPFLRPEDPEVRAAQVRSRNSQERVHAGAASAMSFFVGQTLLTEATALELKSESDEADPLWIAAVLLMILGAIYAGKLTMMSAKCCLRRLQWVNEPQAVVSNEGDESSSSATKDVEMRSSLRRRSGTSSGSGPVQASGASSSGAGNVGPVQAPSAGSMCSSGLVQALGAESSTSSVVFGPVQATSSTSSITAERAGPVQASGASSSSSGLEQASSSSGAGPLAAAAFGPVQAVGASSGSAVTSGPEQASSAAAVRGADLFADAEAAGLEQALRAVAEISARAAADGVSVESALQRHAAGVSEALLGGERSEMTLHNPWNLFQHEHRGKGWSPAQMSKMYKKWRNHQKDKMP